MLKQLKRISSLQSQLCANFQSSNQKNVNIAIIQNNIFEDKSQTLENISQLLDQASLKQGQICILPETFNSFYIKNHLQNNAENFSNSQTLDLIKKKAIQHSIYVIGSIPEKDDEKFFNTAFCIDKKGEMIAKFRKLHLFDIDIKGKITYKESETFSSGNEICVFNTEYIKIGLGICYDLRFPELANLMVKNGAEMIVYPGAFNLTTGPLHWELLLRARAVDNQCIIVGASSARYTQDTSIYQSWGHSTIVDSKGQILSKTDEKQSIQVVTVDKNQIYENRQAMPYQSQKRLDLYETIQKI